VLALHEIAHELKSRKLKGLFLKLDFEKAYDRVSWEFVREILIWKGFLAFVVHRLMQLVKASRVAKLKLTSMEKWALSSGMLGE
jgi:hypothetical protein